ncbi:MAG: VOC family protein [Ignavibacteriaceae bacterium]
MNPVVHFELPADNKKRMTDFYSTAFGWKTEQLGPEMGEYVLVTTSEVGEDHFPKQRGTINGGIYQKADDPVLNYPSVVISVDDINESIQKLKKAGGKVLGEPMPIPGIGSFVSFIDTEGNRLSILQPLPMQ